MPKLQIQDKKTGVYVETAGLPVERLVEKEWLLTNTRGGYASSTVIGCNSRRYHGLLIGSLEPPASRIMALANCLETVFWGMGTYPLSTFEFPGKFLPDGYQRLKRFYRDMGVHFDYEIGELRLTKSVYLLREEDMAALVYDFDEVSRAFDFTIRPFVAMRDFHSLQKTGAGLGFEQVPNGIVVREASNKCGQLLLAGFEAKFEAEPDWWFNFTYRVEKRRGQDFTEDLFNPGVFKYHIDSPTRIVLWAGLKKEYVPGQYVLPDIEYVIQQLSRHRNSIVAPAEGDKLLGEMFIAADQFIVKRMTPGVESTTILAGFPWFADWGRDAFISLPGLLLATRRFDEAKSVLGAFAQAAREGMIPNRFDDYNDDAHFNSVDASLWFINAAFEYLKSSDDRETFKKELLPTIISIVESYENGTMFGIHAEGDGLITAGDSDTQLTWMDAKYDGVAFTPRYGKAVGVNALWYNAIMQLEEYLTWDDGVSSRFLGELRKKANLVKGSFCKLFWNESYGWLNDCILPDGTADATLRPNQIFAVSLPFSPLKPTQQKAVVDIVEKELLTPFGLRTLSPHDPRYQPKYAGSWFERDRAYHQGTVWPYLMGPFIEAYLKVHRSSPKSRAQAGKFIEPLLEHFASEGCLGQLCEIFDAEPPQKPKGCIAQAWSVAQLIHAYLLTRAK